MAPSPGSLRQPDKKPLEVPGRSVRPRSRPISRPESRAHVYSDLLAPNPPLENLVLKHTKTEFSKIIKTSHTHIHRSIMHNSQKAEPPKSPWKGKWVNKMWSIHATEYHSASKRKEVPT